jgi:raffinose/stachyose/melibiose transport system permease protein
MRRSALRRLPLEILGLLLSLLVIVPLYFVVDNSFKTKAEAAQMTLRLPRVVAAVDNYRQVVVEGYLFRALKNSFLLTTISTAAVIVVSSMAAFVIQRRRMRLGTVAWNLILIGLIMPPSMVTTTLLCRALGLVSLPGAGLVFVAVQFPLATFVYRGFLGSVPRELDEAAIIDGCGSARLFFQIIFPLLLPVTMTVFVLNFMEIWNNFTITYYFLSSARDYVMPLTVYFFFGQHLSSWNLVFADIVLIALPVVIAYALAQRHIVSGMIAGSIKG